MLYALMCKDKPNSLDKRLAERPAHVEHLKALDAQGILKMAGPLLGETDRQPGGDCRRQQGRGGGNCGA